MNSRMYVNQVLRDDTTVTIGEYEESVAVQIDGYTLQGPYELVTQVIASAHRQLEALNVTRTAVGA